MFRTRLVDPENIFTKTIGGDCLQMFGLLPNDDAKTIELETRQEKVASPEEEGTLIELTPIYE